MSLTLSITIEAGEAEEEGMVVIIPQSGVPGRSLKSREERSKIMRAGGSGQLMHTGEREHGLRNTDLLLQVLRSTLEHRHLIEEHGKPF